MSEVYTIEDLMKALKISRTTFWRRRKSGAIPDPDFNEGQPRWSHAILRKHLPMLTTNPST